MANLTLFPVVPQELTLRVSVACTDSQEDLMNKTATVVAATVALTLGGAALESQQADAATNYGPRALAVAKSKQGAPYRKGAAGPSAFDCSGLTQYSFKRVGKILPRTTQAQYNAAHHIAWRYRKPGDLVAVGTSGRNITHVGIYAGYWAGKAWMVNANSGHYRGYKVVTAPINEYLGGGRHAYYAYIN